MLALILAKATAANPTIPENTTPGTIFVIVVIASMIAWLVRVWIVNYGSGARKEGPDGS
jgi:hypothetical protein